MSDMVRAWLDHTQQLDQEATPAPWENYDGTVGTTFWNEGEPDFEPLSYTHIMARADAEWIAHARQALPAATAAIRAVLDLCDQWDAEASELLSGAPGVVCDEAFKVRTTITAALASHQHPTPLGSSGKCDHEARGVTWAEGNTTCYVCETCEHEWTERD